MDISSVRPWPVYGANAQAAVASLVQGGTVFDYSGKAPVTELEHEFATLHGQAHVVSFNSGTSALFAAMCAVGVTEGDEVLVPNLTFLASASPLLWLGAHAVLVDSSRDEPSIGPDAIAQAITSRTRAVVVTHLFGNPVDVSAITEICRSHNLKLIEDCSHAHASRVGPDRVGTFGDVSIYSIGAGKLVSGGHGGLLVTRDQSIRDLALLIGHFKPRTRVDVLSPELRSYAEFALGGNLRLSPLAAALALDHLRSLDALSDARCANATVIDQALDGLLIPVRSPMPRENRSHFDLVYRLPPEIPTSARDELVRKLGAVGIPASAPSTRPLNRVLRALPSTAPRTPNLFLRRLHDLAKSVPSDDGVPNSVLQHDRMISFPANRLYNANTRVAEWVARIAEPAVRNVLATHR